MNQGGPKFHTLQSSAIWTKLDNNNIRFSGGKSHFLFSLLAGPPLHRLRVLLDHFLICESGIPSTARLIDASLIWFPYSKDMYKGD